MRASSTNRKGYYEMIPFPKWILELPEGVEKDRAIDAFLIQLGGIYASRIRRKQIQILADTIGINYSTLKSQLNDRRIVYVPQKTFDRIERVMGIQIIEWTPRGLTFETSF